MSASTKSTSESESSPPTGPATDGARAAGGKTAIELPPAHQRYIGWAIGGTAGGAVLIWKLGTVGVAVGYMLVAIGLYRLYQLVQTFRNPAGAFEVSSAEVVLPRAPHQGPPLKVAPTAITAVYFLRRSVPWNRSSPVLVIELGERALTYPRDWFASESDQRHLVHALLAVKPA